MDEMKVMEPELVLDGLDAEDAPAAPVAVADHVKTDFTAAQQFTPEEQQKIDAFAKQIDLNNSNIVIQYGAGAQKKMSRFSESALQSVRTKDLGEVGLLMSDLMVELKGFDEGESKGIKGLFKKSANKIESLKARYAKAEVNVDKIANMLEQHQVTLMKDVAMLDNIYEMNKGYFKELSMYIAAGKQKLQQTRAADLPAAQEKAQASGLPEDAQAANDLANQCNRFEKKLHDLELTRTISLQMAPQIRMVQGNDTEMTEKIQSTLVNTLPLWKNQMVIALGLAHSQEAARVQRTVSDTTNQLLRKNADNLKMATIETAKESERGIVDMETLKHTNEQLISTIDEVLQIQEEGHQRRQKAETELSRLETELKEKLLSIKN
ncbi:MAG: toxic anion resistance protein [Eubacteriales bacterium]|jgi:uncharacterized protein YaaN involved in tellurite resistance|nr:toxic anion resistance protein [Eubacteriales bacterium]